jgi:hypothetical protein
MIELVLSQPTKTNSLKTMENPKRSLLKYKMESQKMEMCSSQVMKKMMPSLETLTPKGKSNMRSNNNAQQALNHKGKLLQLIKFLKKHQSKKNA